MPATLAGVATPTEARIGVVGATGAVGTVTLRLLAERGYENVRAFASARSAGTELPYGDETLPVEEATAAVLGSGELDLCLFSVGTSASRELVPHASASGAICVDKSSAYRLVDGYPLVVPEVDGARALEALERDRIVANPNCCTIPLTCVLKPLHEAAGLRSVRVATYQSVSGAGAHRMTELEAEAPAEHNLVMDWSWVGDESDEESKLVAETRKILELPDLPVSATCVRVPVMVGHSEAVWVELDDGLTPSRRPRSSVTRRASACSSSRRCRRPGTPQAATRFSSAASEPTAHTRTALRSSSPRQPPQGRGAECDPDRRAPAHGRRGLTSSMGRAREVARFLPDCIVLLQRLLRDRRVPRSTRLGIALLVPYLISPVDLIRISSR